MSIIFVAISQRDFSSLFKLLQIKQQDSLRFVYQDGSDEII